jgi:parallel beta-helix repeat protein
MVFVVLAATTAIIPATAAAACGSFQGRVDNARTGSTITIPKCTFHESVEVKKRLTILAYGATIDAGGADHGLRIEASDVTIKGVTVRNAGGSSLDAAIYVNGGSRFTLRSSKVLDSAFVCLSLNGGSGHRIVNNELKGCGKEGYFGNGLSSTLFYGNSIHHNNVDRHFDPQSEAGGGKVMASTGITFDHNKVYDNGGPGIWFDNGVKNVVVRYNRVRDNYESGIMFEISSGAKIYSNTVFGNGFGHDDWGWGAGILISSSDHASVFKNVLAWNARGISVISQSRELSPHTDNLVHDNVIINRSSKYVAGFYDDHGGSLYNASSDNRGYDNRYWIGSGSPSGDRFHWSGGRSSLSSYNATLGEARGHYISTSERNRILRARDVPIS